MRDNSTVVCLQDTLREREKELEALRKRSLTKDYATRLQHAQMPLEMKLNNFDEQQRKSVRDEKERLREAKINLNTYRGTNKNPWDIHYQTLLLHQQKPRQNSPILVTIPKRSAPSLVMPVDDSRTVEETRKLWAEKESCRHEEVGDWKSPKTVETEAMDWNEFALSPQHHDSEVNLVVDAIPKDLQKPDEIPEDRRRVWNAQFQENLAMLRSSAYFEKPKSSIATKDTVMIDSEDDHRSMESPPETGNPTTMVANGSLEKNPYSDDNSRLEQELDGVQILEHDAKRTKEDECNICSIM